MEPSNKQLIVEYFLPNGGLLDTDNVYVPLTQGMSTTDLFTYVTEHLRYRSSSYVVLDGNDQVAPYFKSRLVVKGKDNTTRKSFF